MASYSFVLLFLMAVRRVACITTRSESMCYGGRVLPQLFLLGEQKASTTTLALTLGENSRIAFPEDDGTGDMNEKETHFFDLPDRYEQGLSFYTSLYPKCPPKGQTMVGIDATPQIQMPDVMDNIVDTYRTLVPRLKFVIIFREPLARFQSAFYHFKSHDQEDLDFNTFSEYVDLVTKPGPFSSWQHLEARILWQSNYTEHLRLCYDAFKPEQLMLSTMGASLEPPPGIAPLAQEISSWLNIPMESDRIGENVGEFNVGEHPSIEDDLSKEQFTKLHNLVYKMSGPEKVIANIRDGTILYAYKGPGDFASKVDWLEGGW